LSETKKGNAITKGPAIARATCDLSAGFLMTLRITALSLVHNLMLTPNEVKFVTITQRKVENHA
jgi:hypothetical protein